MSRSHQIRRDREQPRSGIEAVVLGPMDQGVVRKLLDQAGPGPIRSRELTGVIASRSE